jgi:SAM-dependent methyltransferase
MSYKTATQKSYQSTANEFAANVADLAPVESIEKFIKLMPRHAKMIDIGCGSGRDAKIFSEKGIAVLGIDFCSELIEIAKAHAPLAEFQLLDIEEACFPADSFDGAWACCSLQHLPKKTLPMILAKIHSFLKPRAVFYLTLKKGSGEVFEKDLRYKEAPEKFWAFYEEEELREMVQSAAFTLRECCTVHKESAAYQIHPTIRLFCQKGKFDK